MSEVLLEKHKENVLWLKLKIWQLSGSATLNLVTVINLPADLCMLETTPTAASNSTKLEQWQWWLDLCRDCSSLNSPGMLGTVGDPFPPAAIFIWNNEYYIFFCWLLLLLEKEKYPECASNTKHTDEAGLYWFTPGLLVQLQLNLTAFQHFECWGWSSLCFVTKWMKFRFSLLDGQGKCLIIVSPSKLLFFISFKCCSNSSFFSFLLQFCRTITFLFSTCCAMLLTDLPC